jgi:hypothetical protein
VRDANQARAMNEVVIALRPGSANAEDALLRVVDGFSPKLVYGYCSCEGKCTSLLMGWRVAPGTPPLYGHYGVAVAAHLE